MATGTRGGSNDASLPLIATDPITSGSFNAESMQVVKLALGAAGAATLVDSSNAIPVSTPGLGGGIIQTVTSVGVSAVTIPATPLAGRASMLVQAPDTNTAAIYLGKSTVTADTASTGGIKLMPGESIPLPLSSAVLLYAIGGAASQKVVTLEVAA